MRLTVGHSSAPDAGAAAAQAGERALRDATDPAFALVFSTDQYDHDALASAVGGALGPLPWAGCCTAGVFAHGSLLTQGLTVGVFSTREVQFGVGVGGPASADGRRAGSEAVAGALAAMPAESQGHRAIILLPDALTGNAVDVVRGAAAQAGAGVSWAGGGAGDNLRFVRTAQYALGRAFRDRVVAVALDSPRPIASGLRHGWRPYGPPTLVTRAEGATVVELDYERALDVYRRTATRRGGPSSPDSFAEFAMMHPLGIPQADGGYLIRDPLSAGEDGSVRFVAEVPDGSLVRVMEGSSDALLDAAREAAAEARVGAGGPLGGAVVFDCVSRALILGDEILAEFSAIEAQLGDEVPLIGCLTFGEVGVLGGGLPQIHNKTATVLAWRC